MEISILKWVDATFHSQGWLNHIMKIITYLGEFGAVPIAVALILLIFKKTRPAGFATAIALVLDIVLVNLILKHAVNRPRPWTEFEEIVGFYTDFGIRLPTDASFPSGHTGVVFAAAVALTCRYKLKGAPSLIVALLVAISRIYLCVHYPTDVLAGMLIGGGCGVAGHYIALWLYPIVAKFVQEKIINKIKKKKACADGGQEVIEDSAPQIEEGEEYNAVVRHENAESKAETTGDIADNGAAAAAEKEEEGIGEQAKNKEV